MSKQTFICRACGGMRRRPVVYGSARQASPDWPRCHERPMEALTDVQAAGAAKLRKSDRLTWLAHGKRVVRRKGNRWRPALTDADSARADAQRRAYGSASGAA